MKAHRILLWGGRVSGLLMSIFFLAYLLKDGWPDFSEGFNHVLLAFLPFALISLIGYLLAWFRPLTGGRILLGSAVLTLLYFIFKFDFMTAMLFGLPALLVGFCFIASMDKELI